MARPTTKETLAIIAQEKFDKMWSIIDKMSRTQQEAPFSPEMASAGKETHWARDKNLRDVLVHLYEWHQLLLAWVKANTNGEKRDFLPQPYNWRNYPDMNVAFWEKHQATTLPKAKGLLKDSHAEVMKLLDHFSQEELFSKQSFSWTGTTTLGAYFISATASHYDWGIKKLKKQQTLSKD